MRCADCVPVAQSGGMRVLVEAAGIDRMSMWMGIAVALELKANHRFDLDELGRVHYVLPLVMAGERVRERCVWSR